MLPGLIEAGICVSEVAMQWHDKTC